MRDFSKGYFKGYSKAKDEYTHKYVHENTFPKKTYTLKPKYTLRKRRKNEIFLSEILIALAIIFMLVMLYMNYQSNLNYKTNETTGAEKEVDVNIGISKEKKFSPEMPILNVLYPYAFGM
jgi:hypothetical protein